MRWEGGSPTKLASNRLAPHKNLKYEDLAVTLALIEHPIDEWSHLICCSSAYF